MNTRDMAKALGRRGGLIRAQRLSAGRKKQIASIGGTAHARSLLAARRIKNNFRYAAAVAALQPTHRVIRGARFGGRLPGIYPAEE